MTLPFGLYAIQTARLTLTPATAELVRAEIGDRERFSRLLAAEIPDNWPPETVVDALSLFLQWLEAAPDQVGWFGWYALVSNRDGQQRLLVGGGGFLGPPENGSVQLGYSVLPQHRQRGFATELAQALVRWAFEHEGVHRITAETEWANPASVRVLEKLGFLRVGQSNEKGELRFELLRRSV
jgi:RimJ/RimL family protein N-acetyltransferase